MTINYSYGCTTDSLTVDGIETADMTDERIAECIIALLQADYLPDTGDMQQFLGQIVEQYGQMTSHGHCEQCGDNYYTYRLNIHAL